MSTRRDFIQRITAAGIATGAAISTTQTAAQDSVASQKPVGNLYKLPHTDLSVSRIGYGCAGLAGWDRQPTSASDISKAARAIHTAYDNGVTLFDHADIYTYGKSEVVFGQVLKQSLGLRNKIVIQSKCGQTFVEGGQLGDPIYPDLSRKHIVSSVEGSLRRLGTDHLDILLLHIADALMEPDEVAKAFDELHRDGKVNCFGVSNHNAAQIRLLKQSVQQPIVVNQIQISLSNSSLLADGMEFTLQIARPTNVGQAAPAVAGMGTVDYCRSNNIQVQAWSPLRGVLAPPTDAKLEVKKITTLLTEIAQKKGAAPSAIALGWLLRHPAGIVPIIGSSNPEHIVENCAADRVALTREEWYALFVTAAEQ